MNIYVRNIIELLCIDLEKAILIYQNMELDFSEASQNEFYKEVKNTYAFLKATGELK